MAVIRNIKFQKAYLQIVIKVTTKNDILMTDSGLSKILKI